MKWIPSLLIGVTLLLVSCGCPGDVQLGSLRLQSTSFWPYSGNDELVFENKEGELVTFVTSGYSTRADQLRQEILCQETLGGRQESYYLSDIGYTQTFKSLNYYDQVIGLRVALHVDNDLNAAPGDTVFFEIFDIRVDSQQPFSNGGGNFSFLTSTRGQPPARIPGHERRQPRVIADTVLGGRRYVNVFTQPGISALFFTREQGLIAIRTTFSTYPLKRFTRR